MRGVNGFIISPRIGFSSNPLADKQYRNLKCICESGKKVKKCCGRFIYVPRKYAEMYNEGIRGNHASARRIWEDIKADHNKAVDQMEEIKKLIEEKSNATSVGEDSLGGPAPVDDSQGVPNDQTGDAGPLSDPR